MDVRKAVGCGATVACRPTPAASAVGVVSCREQDRAATASTLQGVC